MDSIAYRMEPLIIPGYENVPSSIQHPPALSFGVQIDPVPISEWDHRLLLEDPLAPGVRNIEAAKALRQPAPVIPGDYPTA